MWREVRGMNLNDELQDIIAQSLNAGISQTLVTFSAVNALAGLLADKGIIDYDEYLIAFKEDLLEDLPK